MRRWIAWAALGAAALAAAADDPDAPLARTKEQLQSLKKDEAAQKAGAAGSLKLDLPRLTTPGQDLALPSPRRPDEGTKDRSNPETRQWLLEGVEKLDRKSTSANRRDADKRERAGEPPLDPSSPDYFLRLYERQRADAEAKRLEASAPDPADRQRAAADPFAPFMKEWLANSPVRDVLKDALGGATREAGVSAEAAPGATPPAGSSPLPPLDAPRGTGGNPFVQALGLPPADQPVQRGELRPPVAEVAPVAAAPAPGPATDTIYSLPERAKVDLKHALPPPPAEDKKFFPQLKKF